MYHLNLFYIYREREREREREKERKREGGRGHEREHEREKRNKRYQAIALWGPALFILVFSGVPSFRVALFFFLTEELHFSKDFMVVLNIVGMACALLGVAIYQTFFHSKSVHSVLLVTSARSLCGL